jgi:phage anti-repressor protein
MCENDMFGIDALKIVKYLGMTNPTKFYERLRDKYILNDDYIIKKSLNKLNKGVQDTFYYVSFNGFEKMCIKSKTNKGNKIRNNYSTIRKFINYCEYYVDVIDNIY